MCIMARISNTAAVLTAGIALLAPHAAGALTYKTLIAFNGMTDGCIPSGNLIIHNNLIYGTTTSPGPTGKYGTVYTYDLTTNSESIIATFAENGTDGFAPAGLVYGNRRFYGTTTYGGGSCPNGLFCGTLYSLDPTTGKVKFLYDFNSEGGYFPAGDMAFVKASGAGERSVHRDSSVHRDIVVGALSSGGPLGYGVIYSFDIAEAQETIIHDFSGEADGGFPKAGITYADGLIFGSTVAGGTSGNGVMFQFDPKTATENVILNFGAGANNGSNPQGGLLVEKTQIYGTTFGGGMSDYGTAYGVNLASAQQDFQYDFPPTNKGGSWPSGDLASLNGTIYGANSAGGTGTGGGTVFSINPKSGKVHTVFAFENDVGQPMNGLFASGGALFGTTFTGGANACGTLFELIP